MVSWKRGSIKKESFLHKNLLTLLTKLWPSSEFPVSCKWIPSFHKYSVAICRCSINSNLFFYTIRLFFLLILEISTFAPVNGSIPDIKVLPILRFWQIFQTFITFSGKSFKLLESFDLNMSLIPTCMIAAS